MTVAIAAGGTGGHLFPGIALAERFQMFHPDVDLLFIGTNRGLEARVVPTYGWRLAIVNALPFKGQKRRNQIGALLYLLLGFGKALLLLIRERVKLVIGIGGYVSGPVMLAAWILRVPRVIVEPNAIAGLANRWLGRIALRVFVAFPETARFFDQQKIMRVGNPLRTNMMRVRSYHPPAPDGEVVIACLGGSQGALRLNQLMVESLESLRPIAGRIRCIHQIGPREDKDKIVHAYATAHIKADVVSFIDAIERVYGEAHLVIARAGATTVAELLATARPAILVPYPHATDDHQRANAEGLVHTGGGVLFLEKDLSGACLGAEIRRLIEHPQQLAKMSAALSSFGGRDAAEKIVEECWKYV